MDNAAYKDTELVGAQTDKMKPKIKTETPLKRKATINKKYLDKKADEYLQSVTLHGFTRIFTGSKIESLLWLIILITGCCLIGFVFYDLIRKYNRRDSYINIQHIATNKNYFPAITFCHKRTPTYLYCNIIIKKYNRQYIDMNAKPCHRSTTPKREDRVQGVGLDSSFTNGYFKFTCGLGDYSCSGGFRSVSNDCVTWNRDGNIYNEDGIFETVVSLPSVPTNSYFGKMEIIVHDDKAFGPVQQNAISVTSNNNYEITLEKIIVNRLGPPFPSNCTKEKLGDIFPKEYSQTGCLSSKKCVEGFKKCGDTYDFCYWYIPDHVNKTYRSNNTYMEVESCLREDHQKTYFEYCPLPCEQKYFRTSVSTFQPLSTHRSRKNEFTVRFRLSDPYLYEIHDELQLYDFKQILCESGGFMGLILGGSILSIFEIFVYAGIVATRKFV